MIVKSDFVGLTALLYLPIQSVVKVKTVRNDRFSKLGRKWLEINCLKFAFKLRDLFYLFFFFVNTIVFNF